MMRHRNGPPPDQSSSSEEDDVFSALSRKRKGSSAASISGMSFSKKQATSVVLGEDKVEGPLFEVTQPFNKGTVAAGTSSTKRHHGVVSDARKAKMDAVLLELEAEKNRATVSERPRGNAAPDRNQTRGSFVDPGDEYQTTNIFVGNLAPTITEEQVTDLFRQFGEHSYMTFYFLCVHV